MFIFIKMTTTDLKKENFERILNIVIALLIIIGITIFLMLIYVSLSEESNTDNWRKSSESICFKKLATEFCKENNMEFRKLYIWAYDFDFSCYETFRGNDYNDFDFTREEKLKCGDYYG